MSACCGEILTQDKPLGLVITLYKVGPDMDVCTPVRRACGDWQVKHRGYAQCDITLILNDGDMLTDSWEHRKGISTTEAI
ncbi:hypothetical protein D9601_06465 [Sphingomonas sp. MA1305]|nr:hypothetical protein [Sphingomonas sp. MA1305]